jgi:hypothetical protein
VAAKAAYLAVKKAANGEFEEQLMFCHYFQSRCNLLLCNMGVIKGVAKVSLKEVLAPM